MLHVLVDRTACFVKNFVPASAPQHAVACYVVCGMMHMNSSPPPHTHTPSPLLKKFPFSGVQLVYGILVIKYPGSPLLYGGVRTYSRAPVNEHRRAMMNG